jgi:hypothetical protein
MARIRSVHPGLFTDEAFVSLSDAAQIFYIGLWTEADDQGVFEWKPITLRMRLRPAKDGSVEALLVELEGANCIKSYDCEGRKYGVLRNFGRFQRPRKPKNTHPMPVEFRSYAALDAASTELDDDEGEPVQQKSRNAPQMEDGGGRREDGGGRKEEPPNPQVPLAVEAWNETAIACGLPRAQHVTDKRRKAIVLRLKDVGGLDGWRVLMGKIRASPFLRGGNQQGWRCDFDWVLKPANLTKIMEGNYDDRKSANGIQGAIDDLRRGV